MHASWGTEDEENLALGPNGFEAHPLLLGNTEVFLRHVSFHIST